MKRSRGRGRKPSNPANRTYESNGPDVKIRGNATQIHDKYQQYARDAQTSGDRVNAENYLQHAEHYFRIIAANQPKERQPDQNQSEQDSEDTTAESVNGADNSEDANAVSNDGTAGDKTERDQGEDRPRRNTRRRNYKRKDEAHGDDGTTQDAAKEADDEGLRTMMGRTGSTPDADATADTETAAVPEA